ncbi:MAG: YfcE family phosphodiesterase [Chloroflexota bacterium]
MRIGILADIHGELDALKQALGFFHHQGIETVICAGDLVDRGTDGDKVVEIIRQANIPCVQGNHDAMARRTQEFLARHPDDGLPIEPLKADTVDFLSNLPLEQHFEWLGISVYMTHENPMHDPSKFIYPTASRASFESVVQAANVQIIVLGHTHRPMQVHIGSAQVINPGSIYANYGPYAQTCGVLQLPEQTFELWDVQTGQQLPLQPIRF